MTADRPRSEQAGVEFPSMTWTSFDRYSRYGAIAHAIRASLGSGDLRVLDVGDSAGHLHTFDPGLDVVGIDIEIVEERLPGAVVARANGTRLPFADDTFDAVVSSDVLEHVPPAARPALLAELARASRDLVVVAAPFDTPGVAGVEELARRYALLALGGAQPQLDEHRDNGLPDLDATIEALVAGGSAVTTVGDGNLWDWLLFMLLRFQLEARPALDPLSRGYDLLYNLSLAERSAVAPYYRHLVIARTRGEPRAGARAPSGHAPTELAPLAAALIAADATEVTRQDLAELRGDLDVIRAAQSRAEDRLEHLGTRLEALIDLEVSLAEQFIALKSRLLRLARPFRRGGAADAEPAEKLPGPPEPPAPRAPTGD